MVPPVSNIIFGLQDQKKKKNPSCNLFYQPCKSRCTLWRKSEKLDLCEGKRWRVKVEYLVKKLKLTSLSLPLYTPTSTQQRPVHGQTASLNVQRARTHTHKHIYVSIYINKCEGLSMLERHKPVNISHSQVNTARDSLPCGCEDRKYSQNLRLTASSKTLHCDSAIKD